MSKISEYKSGVVVSGLAVIEDEFVRKPLRNADVDLPISGEIQDFYYNHTGDYMDGCVHALWTNMLLTYGTDSLYHLTQNRLAKNNIFRQIAEYVHGRHMLFNVLSGVISSGIIILGETSNYFNATTSDPNDIPMGIVGALTSMGIRYLSIRKYNLKNKP